MKHFKLIALAALLTIGTVAKATTDPKAANISTQIKDIMQTAEVMEPTNNDGSITIFFRINDHNEISVINAIAYDQDFINKTRKILDGKKLNTGEEYKNRDLMVKIKYNPLSK